MAPFGIVPVRRPAAGSRRRRPRPFVNMLNSQTQRLDRAADKLMPDLRDLQKAQDGTEIKTRELGLVSQRAQCLGSWRGPIVGLGGEARFGARGDRMRTGPSWSKDRLDDVWLHDLRGTYASGASALDETLPVIG